MFRNVYIKGNDIFGTNLINMKLFWPNACHPCVFSGGGQKKIKVWREMVQTFYCLVKSFSKLQPITIDSQTNKRQISQNFALNQRYKQCNLQFIPLNACVTSTCCLAYAAARREPWQSAACVAAGLATSR